MEWVVVSLGALLLAAVGAGVWLWSELQERGRELAESRIVAELQTLVAERDRIIEEADAHSPRMAHLDAEIEKVEREAVAIREDVSRMSRTDLVLHLNELLRKTTPIILAALMLPGLAQAQEAIPMDHDGREGVWMPTEDVRALYTLAAQADRYAATVRLMRERLSLADEVIADLREAVALSRDAQEAAQLLAFGSEERAIKAENAADAPWGRLLWGTVGVVLGAAVGVFVFAIAGGG